ncbi:energy transducer TonB [Mucilaginibacter lacusdianchii]|uniref:energy transducer TonB n=1 Tax=Mucilaginibacter lacusdianchii TaxID=2684211 RepID=UPI00131D6023|nr:energy transducer TonB [Mucilaginibacter sp. JXJ CY 39]
MPEEIKNVQLKFSCTENWNAMSDAAGGRYCDKCQKKVYDFTDSKADEFQRILAENNYNVCGRFTKQQMAAQPVVLPFWKKWLSAAMVLIGINITSCQSDSSQTLVGDTVATPPADSTSSLHTNVKDEFASNKKGNLNACLKIVKQDKIDVPDSMQYYVGGIGPGNEVFPEFPGGDKAWTAYINRNLNHNSGTAKGRVIISFTVEKDGSITNTKVIRSIAKEIDDEALRVIKHSPKWRPGMFNGKPAARSYVIPILFD